jgi:hypothetical protein
MLRKDRRGTCWLVAGAVWIAAVTAADPAWGEDAPLADATGVEIEASSQATVRQTQVTPPAETMPVACCKVCSTGKACGDSCISKTKTCHKPPGYECYAQ